MKGQKTRTILTGVVLGVVALALEAGFAIGLQKTSHAGDPVALPDNLAGGYAAVDVRSNLDQFASEQVTTEVLDATAKGFTERREYADAQLDKAYDVPAATRTYLSSDQQVLVTVTAIRAPGEAVAPTAIVEVGPQTQSGQQVESVRAVKDSVCVLTETVVDPAKGQTQPVSSSCRRSEGDFTLQVAGQADADVIAGLVDRFWDDLATEI